MTGVVRRRAAARRDLVETARYYARTGGVGVADRFLAAAEATFARLAGQPGLGARYEHRYAAVGELRYFPIARFRRQPVFYRPVAGGIEVVRVLHGARDLEDLLAGELEFDEGLGEEP